MLTASAFNAVLKTLEEPPRHAVFILATTEPQKIPATILSRCMRFDFKLIPQKDLEELIKSVLDKTGKKYEDEAVAAIARAGAGSARDSLSIADMCASYSSGTLTYSDVNSVLGSADFSAVAEVAQSVLKEDASASLSCVENILSTGKSVGVLVKDLLNFMNECAIIKTCKNAKQIVNLPAETFAKIKEVADGCDGHKILRVTEILAKAESDLRYSLSGRITLETAIMKCAMPQADYNIDALVGKISELERKIANGIEVKVKQAAPSPQIRESIEKPAPQVKTAPALQPDEEETPFKRMPEKQEAVQPVLWETQPQASAKPFHNLTEEDKRGVFGRFLRSLRTTHKNAILFTLCMDLNSFFEGEKLVLTTDSEAVLKGLTRPDNANFISETLLEFGVSSHEVRLVKAGESAYDKAVEELKHNFEGIDVEIK